MGSPQEPVARGHLPRLAGKCSVEVSALFPDLPEELAGPMPLRQVLGRQQAPAPGAVLLVEQLARAGFELTVQRFRAYPDVSRDCLV